MILGIHHITSMASNAQINCNFYHQFLGQRLVKRTVNFDDPGTYHLYYGDRVGTPGTISTFFPWEHLRPGRGGVGSVVSFSYSISESSYSWWKARLEERGVLNYETERFGERVLGFSDPDRLTLEFVVGSANDRVSPWSNAEVSIENNATGFHSATLVSRDRGATLKVLSELGFELLGAEDGRERFKLGAGEVPGAFLEVLSAEGLPQAVPGAGTVHHIAFRVEDDYALGEWQRKIKSLGLHVTEFRDRFYFLSIYFREPGGVLFELATDPPGFPVDESEESLGGELKLPPEYEQHRASIEAKLPALTAPDASR